MNMVWCPIHFIYLHGKKARQLHAEKFDCDFIMKYHPYRKMLPKYNGRNNGEHDEIHKKNYLWKRDRKHRSKFVTDKIKKGR